MGKKIDKKLIVIISLLCITSVLSYMQKEPLAKPKKTNQLNNILLKMDGYSVQGQIKMDKQVYDFLKLDDHIYTSIKKGNIDINLYIGYYFSADKVSSAHSPLVCFPAQGWDLCKPTIHSIKIGNEKVKYASMVGELGDRKMLIVYWYQTYLKATPHRHIEKVYALYNRLINNKEQNAFVRITLPIEMVSKDEAHNIAKEFIGAFYPIFIDYIKKT